jgi:hypothetical protein
LRRQLLLASVHHQHVRLPCTSFYMHSG